MKKLALCAVAFAFLFGAVGCDAIEEGNLDEAEQKQEEINDELEKEMDDFELDDPFEDK